MKIPLKLIVLVCPLWFAKLTCPKMNELFVDENLMQDLIVLLLPEFNEIIGAFSIISKLVGANKSILIFWKIFVDLFKTKNSIIISKVKISTIASI